MKTWKAHTEIISKAKNLSDCVARLLTYLPFYLTVVTAILVSTVIYSILLGLFLEILQHALTFGRYFDLGYNSFIFSIILSFNFNQ